MENYKISIIVPVYNVEKHLSRCLECLLKQTYKNIEIILIDDGSTDRSGKICDEYKEKDNRIDIIHKKNEGVSVARNTALEKVSGQYVMFVDADDWIDENMCLELLSCAVKNEINMVISPLINVYPETDISKICIKRAIKPQIIKVKNEFSFLEKYATGTIGGVLYSKKVLDKLKFDKELFVGEDTLFFAQALKKCESVAYLENGYYFYVQYDLSAAHGEINEKRMTNLLAWEKIADVFKDNFKIYVSVRGAYGRQCAYFIHNMCMRRKKVQPYFDICKHGMKKNWKYMMKDPSRKNRIYYFCIYWIPQLYCKLKKQI